MKCDNCGKLLGANILKCPNCGNEIKSPEEDIEVLDTEEEVEVHNEPSIISSEEISLDNIEDSKVIDEKEESFKEETPVVEEEKPKKKKKKKKKSKKEDNSQEEPKEEDNKAEEQKEETTSEENIIEEPKEEDNKAEEQKEEVKEEKSSEEDNKAEEQKEETTSEENLDDQNDDTLIAKEAEVVEEAPVIYEHIVNGDEVVPLPPKKNLAYRIKDFFNSWFEGYEKASEIKSDDRTTRLTLDKIYDDTNKKQRDKKIDSNDVFMFWLACFVVSFISFFIFTCISFIVDIAAGKHNNIPLLTFIIPAFQIGIPILLTGFGWLWGIIYSLIKRNGNKNR